jgi:hypothetical protein
MQDLKIENPEDWHRVEDTLKKLIRTMPEFYNDYYRIRKNLEIKIKELSELDIKVRRSDSLYYNQLRKDKLQEINDITRLFSKMYLIATLAKR